MWKKIYSHLWPLSMGFGYCLDFVFFLLTMMKFHNQVSRSVLKSREKKESSRNCVYFVSSRNLGFNSNVIKFL